MITCSECQCELKRAWSCNCSKSVNDEKMAKLQPFISKMNGWANFLHNVSLMGEERKVEEVSIGEIPENPKALFDIDFERDNRTLDQVYTEHIRNVYRNTGFNKMETARILGVTVKTIYNKIESYGIETPERFQ